VAPVDGLAAGVAGAEAGFAAGAAVVEGFDAAPGLLAETAEE